MQAGRLRSDSAAALLIALLPAPSVLSAPTARGAIGVSQQGSWRARSSPSPAATPLSGS